MASTSTSQPDPGGRDDGRGQARPTGINHTSPGNVTTSSKRNAAARDKRASRTTAPAAPVHHIGVGQPTNKRLDPVMHAVNSRPTRSFPVGTRALATWQRMSKNKDTRPEATKIADALNLRKNCPNPPPVEGLEQVQTEFENADLDMQMPCTMTNTDPCWVLDNLRTFNRVLMRADIEIIEEEPRRLSVRSFDYTRPARSNESALLNACILLDVLIKGHRCVQTLHLGQDIVGTRSAQILCASLAFNKSLKHMTAESLYSGGHARGHQLIESICEMPALESLCIAGLFLEASTAARLGGMIAKVKSVRSVKFLRNNMSSEAGEELMKGVCQNSNLEVIWLSHNAIGRGGAHLCGDYLARSSKLRDLSLCSLRGHHEEQLAYVTEGLKTNRALERLQIDGCRVAPGFMVSFAEVLKNHGTLKHLTVTNCLLGEAEAKSFAVLLEYNASLLELDLSCNTIGDIGAIRLAGSLMFNVHLQKLNLAVNSITSHGAVPLVEALASNRVLKELHLWYVGDEENDLPLTSALNRTAVHGRVLLRHDSLTGVLQLSAGLLQNADLVTSLHLCASVRVNAHCLEKLFISLATIPCLNSLVIKSKTSMNGSAADRFAELLLATRTLKRVQINRCDARSVALQTVMGSLANNETVSHMEVQFAARSSASTRAIVDMLNSNTTLTHFGNITAAPSELQLIARKLRSNRVLTSLKVYTMDGVLRTPDLAEAVFEINEVLRRNVSYLNRAVEFAMNPEKLGNQRHPAALFEELYHSESFKDHLARIAGPDGAVEAVRNARRHIQENLFAITGVVRQLPVTCWPHPEGARQIDTLDTYSWRNVMAYLKITDIVV